MKKKKENKEGRYCNCKEWKKSIPQITAELYICYDHRINYTGRLWEYCPWCGKKLKRKNEI